MCINKLECKPTNNKKPNDLEFVNDKEDFVTTKVNLRQNSS